jgi:hypothetical protein
MLRWDNGGWVIESNVSGTDVQYVLRLGPDHSVRQFLLFRDLEEPDLWLATDGAGRWGEMNGSERHDLFGCSALAVGCSPSSTLITIRSLNLGIGEQATVQTATVDVETLDVLALPHTYTRLDEHRWSLAVEPLGLTVVFDVGDDDVLSVAPGWFRRVPTGA